MSFFQFGFVYFYKVYYEILDICLCSIFRRVQSGYLLEVFTPFLRVFFSTNVSEVFGGSPKVISKSFRSFPRKLASLFSISWSTNHLGGLCFCCWVDILLRSCLTGFFGLLLVPKCYLFLRGSKILGGTALHLRMMSWKVFSLTFCIIVQQQRNSLVISSLLSDGLTLVTIFPLHYVENKRTK